MSKPKTTAIAFERRYGDDSGVEFGVRMVNPLEVEIEAQATTACVPMGEVDWLIACLQKIKAEAAPPTESEGGNDAQPK